MAPVDQLRVRDSELHTTPDSGQVFLREQSDIAGNGANQRIKNAADSAALVQSRTLPDVTINGTDAQVHSTENRFMRVVHDAEAAAPDLFRGAMDEVTHHPLQVIESAAFGLAIGTATLLAGPEVAAVAAIAGTGYAAYELATHAGGWFHSADVVAHASDYSATELSAAHRDLHNVGGGAALYGAGIAGALAAGPMTGALSETATATTSSALESEIAAETTNAVPVQEVAETTNAVPVQELALTPEQIALQRSIVENQAIFADANARGEVVQSVKQLYNVQFERVGSGGRLVPTLENPAGVEVPEGGWVATRLNADGSVNMENGMVNQWTPEPKQILKQYVVNPDQLDTQISFIAPTNTSAPPVAMVRLTEPHDFQTPWGPMHGDAGDWLSNYDFNTATGEAGSDFARVTAASYRQTYEPVTNSN